MDTNSRQKFGVHASKFPNPSSKYPFSRAAGRMAKCHNQKVFQTVEKLIHHFEPTIY